MNIPTGIAIILLQIFVVYQAFPDFSDHPQICLPRSACRNAQLLRDLRIGHSVGISAADHSAIVRRRIPQNLVQQFRDHNSFQQIILPCAVNIYKRPSAFSDQSIILSDLLHGDALRNRFEPRQQFIRLPNLISLLQCFQVGFQVGFLQHFLRDKR